MPFEGTMPSAVAVPVPTDGTSIGEIQIPRLGLWAMIAQGESAPILRRSVGHLPDTALPGEVGNVVLAGHRDTFFRPLSGVRAGWSKSFLTMPNERKQRWLSCFHQSASTMTCVAGFSRCP
jgi:sortase (surface protein transpeptidase)